MVFKIKRLLTFHVFTFIFFTFNIQDLSGQKELVDTYIPSTVLIKYQGGGSASGVILADSMFLYLVTAKHCLLDETKNKLLDSSINIIYYINESYKSKPDTLNLNLNLAYAEKNLLFHKNKDIAIVVLARILRKTKTGGIIFNYTKSTRKLTLSPPGGIATTSCINFNKVDVGNDCLILGFPASLQSPITANDYDFNRPLLRKGIISGKDISKGTIIIDCPSYQGNSGGPAISSTLNANGKIGIIGIVSRSLLNTEELISSYYKSVVSVKYENSGYSVIVPIEYALELMNFRNRSK